MKKILLILIASFLISCDKDDDSIENSVIGEWLLVEKVKINDNTIKSYPDSLVSNIVIKFQQDSIVMFGCDMLLGTGNYELNEQTKLSVNDFTFIEPCSLNGWIETVTNCLIHSVSINLESDTLTLIADEEYCNVSLKFVKE